jgi:hypothetical protein
MLIFFFLMIILQMFPVAVTCGNTFVLKPSEKDPGDSVLLLSYVVYQVLEHYFLHDTMICIILQKGFEVFLCIWICSSIILMWCLWHMTLPAYLCEASGIEDFGISQRSDQLFIVEIVF